MEKILVAIDGKHDAWEALTHACSLAKRIDVQISVLLVTPQQGRLRSSVEKELLDEVKKRLALHIETAKAQGVMINYFLAEGKYEDEVINFVNHNRITLVMHQTKEGKARSSTRESAILRSLLHRITCKVEVIAPKKKHT